MLGKADRILVRLTGWVDSHGVMLKTVDPNCGIVVSFCSWGRLPLVFLPVSQCLLRSMGRCMGFLFVTVITALEHCIFKDILKIEKPLGFHSLIFTRSCGMLTVWQIYNVVKCSCRGCKCSETSASALQPGLVWPAHCHKGEQGAWIPSFCSIGFIGSVSVLASGCSRWVVCTGQWEVDRRNKLWALLESKGGFCENIAMKDYGGPREHVVLTQADSTGLGEWHDWELGF